MNLMGINFVNPEYQIWGLAILGLILVLLHTSRWRHQVLSKLGFKAGIAFTRPKFRKLKNFLYVFGIFMLWLALMGPQWGQKEMTLTENGLDLCLSIDISKSMLAEDLRPSRLEAVKNQLPLFFNQLSGDRIAVTAFAGSSFIASPLTSDYSALNSIIDPLATDFISDQSTNLASGIDSCLSALRLDNINNREEMEGSASKVILLITDGGSTADEESAVLDRAVKLGVPVFVMAVGTAQGAYIPIRDEYGIQYIKDPKNPNEPYVTKLEEKSLAVIAEKTGGQIFYASAGNQAWLSFKKKLDAFERESKEAGAKRNLEDRFQIPLAIAFVALLLELMLSETKLWVLLFFFLTPSLSQAKNLFDGIDDLQTFIETKKGNSKFKEKKFDESVPYFTKALESSNQEWTPRLNWATSKIFQSLPKEGEEKSRKSKDPPKSLLEAERTLEDLQKEVPASETLVHKVIKYQLAWVKWLKNERLFALKYFYDSLDTAPVKELDEATKQNITLLLVQMTQSGSGGGGGDSKDGEGEGDQNSKVSQGQGEKPKFSGTDIDENQAGKILQSVGTKELETQKKKTRGEAKDRDTAQKGDEKGKSSGKDPQW